MYYCVWYKHQERWGACHSVQHLDMISTTDAEGKPKVPPLKPTSYFSSSSLEKVKNWKRVSHEFMKPKWFWWIILKTVRDSATREHLIQSMWSSFVSFAKFHPPHMYKIMSSVWKIKTLLQIPDFVLLNFLSPSEAGQGHNRRKKKKQQKKGVGKIPARDPWVSQHHRNADLNLTWLSWQLQIRRQTEIIPVKRVEFPFFLFVLSLFVHDQQIFSLLSAKIHTY